MKGFIYPPPEVVFSSQLRATWSRHIIDVNLRDGKAKPRLNLARAASEW